MRGRSHRAATLDGAPSSLGSTQAHPKLRALGGSMRSSAHLLVSTEAAPPCLRAVLSRQHSPIVSPPRRPVQTHGGPRLLVPPRRLGDGAAGARARAAGA